jgi:twitching motility protein PilT
MSLKAIICQQLVTTKNNSRCAAFEIMIANSAVKNLIRTNNIHNINSAIETGSQIGMTSMESYLKKLKEENII